MLFTDASHTWTWLPQYNVDNTEDAWRAMVQVTGRFNNKYRTMYDGWRSMYTQARVMLQSESSDNNESNNDESL